MSDPKGGETSNVPSSGSDLHEMDPGAQASMQDTEGSLPQATSVAQSRPRRAAAAASSIQQCGAPHQNSEATRTTSRKANEANDEDPNVTLYCADGTVWKPRPLPKILLDLMNPRSKPLPANSETKAVPVQAITTGNKNNNSHVPVPSETEALSNKTSPTPINIDTQTVPVVQATTTTNNNKKKS